MKLPENFSFSQQNLQDFLACKYRFLLKYIHRLAWPSIESEPVMLQEARMELGQQFHRMVQQYFARIDENILASTIQDEMLAEWWQSFIAMKLIDLEGQKSAEKVLTIPFAGHRLVAKYDLLMEKDGIFTIYDWKTSLYLPSRLTLAKRMQSIIYPFVLHATLSAQKHLHPSGFSIDMIYWFAAHPTDPIHITYPQGQYAEDEEYLSEMINQISSNNEDWFIKTIDEENCKYCRYRSLCDRGTKAGIPETDEDFLLDESTFDLDFDAL